jgi:hypothetical protein
MHVIVGAVPPGGRELSAYSASMNSNFSLTDAPLQSTRRLFSGRYFPFPARGSYVPAHGAVPVPTSAVAAHPPHAYHVTPGPSSRAKSRLYRVRVPHRRLPVKSQPPSVPLPHGTQVNTTCISLTLDPVLSGEDPIRIRSPERRRHRKDGQLCACAWVTRRTVTVSDQRMRVAGIRGVVTDPDRRRRGYGRAVMERAYELMRSFADCDVALLFSSVMAVPFYENLGWRPVAGPVTCEQPGGRINYTQALPPAPVMALGLRGSADPLHGPIHVSGLPRLCGALRSWDDGRLVTSTAWSSTEPGFVTTGQASRGCVTSFRRAATCQRGSGCGYRRRRRREANSGIGFRDRRLGVRSACGA